MKIVFISDTHRRHEQLNFNDKKYKNVDMIIHSGDFSNYEKDADKFIQWYSEQPFKYKILIPGNHDFAVFKNEKKYIEFSKKLGIELLIDRKISIEGINIYGSPWTPEFFNWAYMKNDHILKEIWDKIPYDTHILVTHGPAKGSLDKSNYGNIEVGSFSLSTKLYDLKENGNLKIHSFGHIHEARGFYKENDLLRINSSSVNHKYQIEEPFIVDYEKNDLIFN